MTIIAFRRHTKKYLNFLFCSFFFAKYFLIFCICFFDPQGTIPWRASSISGLTAAVDNQTLALGGGSLEEEDRSFTGIGEISSNIFSQNIVYFFFKFFPKFFKNFSVLAGGRCPPDTPVFGWGAKAPPDHPLDGFSRGAAAPQTPRAIFPSDDTGAADDRPTT